MGAKMEVAFLPKQKRTLSKMFPVIRFRVAILYYHRTALFSIVSVIFVYCFFAQLHRTAFSRK